MKDLETNSLYDLMFKIFFRFLNFNSFYNFET